MRESVNHAHADGFPFLLVVNNRFDHRIRSKGQVARLLRPRQSRGVGGKISPINTATVAHVLVHALRPPLIQVDLLGVGEVGTATLNEVPLRTIHFLELLLIIALDAAQFKTGLHHLIGKHIQTVSTSCKAHKGLYISVPGFHVLVANGPIYGITVASGAFKIIVRPALRASSPEQGLAPDVVAPKPAEWLLLDVRLLILGKRPMHGLLPLPVGSAQSRTLVNGHSSAEFKFPRCLGGGGIVFDVTDHASSFQHQGLQAFFGQLFGRPSSGSARADDNRIVGSFCF